MKGTFWVGTILILIGVVLLVYQGFSYNTRKTAEIGPIDITVPHTESVYVPPVIGGVVLILGLFITFIGYKKSKA